MFSFILPVLKFLHKEYICVRHIFKMAQVVLLVEFSGSSMVKNSPANKETSETWVRSLCWEDPLEEGMATHSSILGQRIPWTEKPGRLQSMWSQRVRLSTSTLVDQFAFCELFQFGFWMILVCEVTIAQSPNLDLSHSMSQNFREERTWKTKTVQSPWIHLTPRSWFLNTIPH